MEKELELRWPEPGTDFIYTLLEDGTVRIDHYCGFDRTVVVPEEMAGAPVTELGKDSLSHSDKMERVVLPAGLKRIGISAFHSCKRLKEIGVHD